jgi:undecaprenyl-diphosphatase
VIEEIISYLILGLVQGLTEFLPVSSSGHLTLFSELLGIQSDDLTFKVLVHFATAMSTIVVFRKDIASLATGFFKSSEEGVVARKYIGLLAVSAVPAAIIGLTLKDQIESLDTPHFVGYMLIVTAVILAISQKLNSSENKDVNGGRSILIGVSQALAILPGISRSGSTIGAALLLGVSRAEAAKFSFLMALPVILGATLLETKDLLEVGVTDSGPLLGYIVGVIAAFVSGLIACKLMIKLVKGTNLLWFAVYCAVVGLFAIII